MKLQQIKINSFRNIPELTLDFDSNVKLIIGADDRIRTNILDAIAIGISNLFCGFNDFKPLNIKENDNFYYKPSEILQKEQNLKLPALSIECDVLIENKRIKYTKGIKLKKAGDLVEYSNKIQKQISNGEDNCNLPLIAYYRAERKPIIENKEFTTRFKPCSRMVGYKDCFNSPNGKMVSSWLHSMQMDEYAKNTTINVLEYFRGILNDLGVPSDPYCENQTRCQQYLISIIADLAYRSSILNPSKRLGDIQPFGDCETNGIVLIDAIELNLELEWQREILTKLAYTFPNIQFIATTDSPLVISGIKAIDITVLDVNYEIEEPYKITAKIPEFSYGRDCNQILECLMDTSSRPKQIKDKLLYIFKMIEEDNLDEAIAERDVVIELIGEGDPEITKIDVLIKKRKSIKEHLQRAKMKKEEQF